jgi:hypothetical protein
VLKGTAEGKPPRHYAATQPRLEIPVKHAFLAAGLIILATFAAPAMADDARTVYGSASAMRMLAPYLNHIEATADVALVASPSGTGQLVLDLIDGKVAVAAIAMPLPNAVAAARVAAWEEGRMLVIPESLQFHPVSSLSANGNTVGFVTLGAQPARLQKVLDQLR